MHNLEKQYEADGCDVSVIRLRQNGEFLAPPDLHSKITDNLEALAQIEEMTFEIANSALEVLINTEPELLISLVKSKCYLEKKVHTRQTFISIPKAQVADLEDLEKQARTARTTNSSSINIGQSTITIAIGDLTAQAVSLINILL
jgi:hypothetical protein